MNFREFPDRELVQFCLQGNQQSWFEFMRRFHSLIAGVVARTIRRSMKPDSSLVDDLVIDAFAKLCMNNYKALRELEWPHENAFRGFLKVVASNVAQDHLRKRKAQKRDKEEEQLDELHDHAAVGVDPSEGVEHSVMIQQLVRCLEKIAGAEPDFQRSLAMFLLYFKWGVTAKDISRVYSLGLKSVENNLSRLARIAKTNCLGGWANG
jgi:RNA polymerase sigma-70 factor, ECF subfamily